MPRGPLPTRRQLGHAAGTNHAAHRCDQPRAFVTGHVIGPRGHRFTPKVIPRGASRSKCRNALVSSARNVGGTRPAQRAHGAGPTWNEHRETRCQARAAGANSQWASKNRRQPNTTDGTRGRAGVKPRKERWATNGLLRHHAWPNAGRRRHRGAGPNAKTGARARRKWGSDTENERRRQGQKKGKHANAGPSGQGNKTTRHAWGTLSAAFQRRQAWGAAPGRTTAPCGQTRPTPTRTPKANVRPDGGRCPRTRRLAE